MPKTVKTIAAIWESYRQQVLPPDAPPVQVRECRLAFYGGFHAMMQINLELGGDEYSEDQGFAVLNSIDRELQAFFEAMTADI